MIWFTERKSILIDIFVNENLKKNIPELWNNFHIIEFVENKYKNWIDIISVVIQHHYIFILEFFSISQY